MPNRWQQGSFGRQAQYVRQRPRVTPPHAPLAALRFMSGMTLAQVADRAAELFPSARRITVGALSGIEHGHRGASEDMLGVLEAVYGLPRGSLTTSYKPRDRELPLGDTHAALMAAP